MVSFVRAESVNFSFDLPIFSCGMTNGGCKNNVNMSNYILCHNISPALQIQTTINQTLIFRSPLYVWMLRELMKCDTLSKNNIKKNTQQKLAHFLFLLKNAVKIVNFGIVKSQFLHN